MYEDVSCRDVRRLVRAREAKEYQKLGVTLRTLRCKDIAAKFDLNEGCMTLFHRLTDEDFELIRGLLETLPLYSIAKKFEVQYSHLSLFRKTDRHDCELIRALLAERKLMLARRKELQRSYYSRKVRA